MADTACHQEEEENKSHQVFQRRRPQYAQCKAWGETHCTMWKAFLMELLVWAKVEMAGSGQHKQLVIPRAADLGMEWRQERQERKQHPGLSVPMSVTWERADFSSK